MGLPHTTARLLEIMPADVETLSVALGVTVSTTQRWLNALKDADLCHIGYFADAPPAFKAKIRAVYVVGKGRNASRTAAARRVAKEKRQRKYRAEVEARHDPQQSAVRHPFSQLFM